MLEQFTVFDQEDDIVSVIDSLETSGIFTNNNGSITSFYTSSEQIALSSSNYYWHIYDSAETSSVMFDITYGNANTTNGLDYSGDSYAEIYTPDQAIYKQYANICLPSDESVFTFADNTTGSGEIFVINFAREQLKDGLDEGNWQLNLTDSTTINLIDNSTQTSPTKPETGINAGDAYYICSGSGLGSSAVIVDTVVAHPYGIVYPKLGLIILNAKEVATDISATLDGHSPKTNIQIFNDSIVNGAYFAARDEEKVSSTHYFCRVKNKKYNFSNNPTWQTGSAGLIKYTEMYNDPQAYITTIGLYDDDNNLVATAKLNKPQLKNFERELLIKVKVSY